MAIRVVVWLAVGLFAVDALAGKQQRPLTEAPAPPASIVPLPYFEGAHAIWGATGQDRRGHIWFGVTTGGITPNSAHLFEFDPLTGTATDRGDVVAALKRSAIWRPGEQQAKIHSRIVQGPDNYLYFASMDEEGEQADGTKLPDWGGHLWRLSLTTYRWEHLLRTPEALIAVGGGGSFIYALGYFGHVLYQYDTKTGNVGRLAAGSIDGHISRNLLVDSRGHAYVPRLVAQPATGSTSRLITITLVEIGRDLRQVRDTPIEAERYLGMDTPTDSHGIVALQPMPDGSIFFTTHTGFLYQVTPPAKSNAPVVTPSEVRAIGWLHPGGPSYPASLFTRPGAGTLSSAVRRQGLPWQWVTCDLNLGSCRVAALEVPGRDRAALGRTLLYGSATRDAKGGHYVVGIGHDYRPIALRIQGL